MEDRKTPVSDFEEDSQDLHLEAHVRRTRLVDGARAGTTLLALLMGVVVVGVAANSIAVYNATNLSLSSATAWLSLWPDAAGFDFRPTIALVAGGATVVLTNLVALMSHHRAIRPRLGKVHTPLTFTAPLVGLTAAVIAMAFFYAIDTSTTADTVLSWSCRWRHVVLENSHAHFATLCRTSHAGVYLAILLIPVEAAALALAGWQLRLDRYTQAYTHARKTASPVLA